MKETTIRRLASLRTIAEKAAELPCQYPDNCGDGWNSYDCVSCAANAVKRHYAKKKRVSK